MGCMRIISRKGFPDKELPASCTLFSTSLVVVSEFCFTFGLSRETKWTLGIFLTLLETLKRPWNIYGIFSLKYCTFLETVYIS